MRSILIRVGGVISAAKAWAGYLTRPATKNLKIFSEKLK